MHSRSGMLTTAVEAARRGGDVIMKNLGRLSSGDIQTKKASDFVTTVDRWSESVMIDIIRKRFPSHSFLTEESIRHESEAGYRWIIDPLDGTTNFIHGFPVFSVSIALEKDGCPVIGVVFDPLRDELFHAEAGHGSFVNNRPIRVSPLAETGKSLVATGFPFKMRELTDTYLRAFREVFCRVSDIRRAGSAALDLAFVASGRLDGFFELGLSPWDMAAGRLLIEEAGGVVTDFGGGPDFLRSGNIVAGNNAVHEMLLKIMTDVFRGTVDR